MPKYVNVTEMQESIYFTPLYFEGSNINHKYDIDVFKQSIKLIYKLTAYSSYEQNPEGCILYIFKYLPTNQFGYYELIPAGYSSWTYDPDEMLFISKYTDWDEFVRMSLTDAWREELNKNPQEIE